MKSAVGPLLNAAKELVSCPSKMADILSKQYESVFSKPKTPPLEPSDYYSNDDNDETYLKDIPFTRKDIKDAMDEIPLTASAGPDRFPAILLKKCSDSLSEPLFLLWQKSLSNGKVPSVLKTANIIPIHKGKGASRTDAKNYRPIALTSHLIKIFEKVIRKYIVVFTRTPVPALHVIFIISAPLLYLNHRIHDLKLSEIISKDGEYIGDFRFRRGLPSERHSYLYLTYSARVCF